VGQVPAYLRDGDTALRWAKENLDLSIDEDNHDVAAIEEQDYENKAYAYAYFAMTAFEKPWLKVYRMVCVPSVKDIQIHNLGKAWSKEERGAGCYGTSGPDGSRSILVEGRVRPRDVDWAYGFSSFMMYGEEQWEVSMDENAPVLVTAIDGKSYDPPLKGSTGRAREVWQPRASRKGQRSHAAFRTLADVKLYGQKLLGSRRGSRAR